MNHAYRLVWSDLSASPVAVPETAAGRGKGHGRRLARRLVGASVAGALAWGAQAQNLSPTQLPGQAQVSAGTVSMTRAANALVVKQTSDKAVLNWSSFDIGRDASVSFVQPGASSTALNRVQGGVATQIEGRLSANGQVFLVNPSGIVFGRGAQVNVAGLVASSLDWATEDFLADRWQFAGPSTAGAVVNQGRVQADGGVITLVAPRVSNSGSLQADGGQVVLAAGQKVAFKVSGSGLLQVTVDQGAVDALVENKGLIHADGGSVLLTAKGANALLSGVVNNEGVVRAHTLQEREGRIVLLGDMDSGSVQVGGQLDASAPQGGKGGFIETSAAQVFVARDARISTLAAQGQHGTWLIDPVDFNIATGGNITGAQLGTQLEGGNITILSSSGSTGTVGNVNVQEAVSWSAATTLTLDAQGSVNLNADLSAASGHLAINAAAGGLSGSGAMNFGGSQQTVTVNQGGNSTYSGVISGTGASLSKIGAGTLTLSGASSYSGGTTVSAGTLQAGASSSGAVTQGPLGTAGVTVASGATLDLAGQSLVNALNLSGQGVGAAGALINSSATDATASGAVTLAADTAVGTTGAGTLRFAGTVDGAYALSVKSQGDVAFNGVVGGNTPLASITTDAGGRTLLGANVTTTGTQTYNDDVVASAAITLQALGVVVPASASWTAGLPVSSFAISDGSSPSNEAVQYAFDSNLSTKYLNFKGPGSDVLMDLGTAQVVSKVNLTSGPDECCRDRDPTSYTLYGSNTAFIAGNSSSPGGLPNAVKLGSGVLAPPDGRRADYTDASLVFDNSTPYRYYRLVFDTVRSSPNLVQISEIGLSRAASVDTSTAALNFKAGLSGMAALTLQSAGSLSAKTIQTAGALTLQHDGVGTVQGVISDGASTLSLIKAGTGALSLLGANTYTGGTSLNAGTLGIYTNTALGTGALTVGTAALKIGRAVTQLDNALVLNGTASLAFDRDVDYLVVGGGGAGASGGGGAGGFLSGTTALTDASYAVTVGAGGTSAGSSGTASVAFGQTAGGGGGGGGGASAGKNGASGGGGGYDGQSVVQATGIAGQGFSGGVSNRNSYGAGAGGGGAGSAGGNALVAPDSYGRGGDGGLGKASDITGEVKYYAGGGGGGANTPISGTPGGTGGSGVGGAGATGDRQPGLNAVANTGSGGGGAEPQGSPAGRGAAGIVVARYKGAAAGTGGTVAAGTGTAEGYTVHTFTSGGTLALNPADLTLAGPISGIGALSVNATGGSVKLSAANTYSGGTTVSGGTLFGGADSGTRTAFGSGAITVGLNAVLRTDHSTLANALVLSGGTLKGSNGFGESWSGGISLNADSTVDADFFMTLSGNISGAGRLSKVGDGVLSLSGANSYSGGTQINAGTLKLTGTLNSNTDVVLNGTSVWDLQATQTVASLSMAPGSSITRTAGTSSLTVSGASTLANSVSTSGGQTYNGAVTLAAATSLSGSTVHTGSTVNGGYALTIDGNAYIDGAIGGLTALRSLSVTGTSQLGANVTTSGAQSYTGAVTLSGGDHSLSTENSQITFGNTVNSEANQNRALSLNVGTSEVQFDGVVGGNQGLGALAITGALDLNAEIASAASLSVSTTSDLAANVTTRGMQSYTGAVTVGSGDRVLTGDEIDWGSSVAGTGALTLRPATTSRQMYLGGSTQVSAGLNLDAAELGRLSDGFTSITLGHTTGTGGIETQGATTFKDPVTFAAAGGTTVAHDLSAVASTDAGFKFSAPLTWTGGNITTGTGAITVANDATLGGSGTRTMSTSSGTITVGSSLANTVTGNATNVTFNSGSATTTLNAALADVGILGLGTANQTGSLYVLGDVSATGLLTGSTNYDIHIGQPAMALDHIQITADNGYTAYLNGTLLGSGGDWGSPQKYTLPASAVNGTNVFAVAAYDAGGIASMQAEIKLRDGTVLGSDGTWKWTISNPTANASWNTVGFNDAGWSTNGSVMPYNSGPWGNKLDNTAGRWIWSSDPNNHDNVWFRFAFDLNSVASANRFVIGSGATLQNTGKLLVQTTGNVSFDGNLSAQTQSAITLGSNVSSTGSQTYGAPVSLSGGHRTLTGTLINTSSTLAGASNALTIAGNLQTGGAYTGLSSLSVAGTTHLGGNVTTSGAQTYGGAMTVNASSTLSGSGLSLAAVDLGSNTLTANEAGTGAISGVVSGAGALTKTGAGTLSLSNNNTFAGGVTVNAGVLKISADSNLGAEPVTADADALTLNGGTLQVTADTTLASTRGTLMGSSGGTFLIDPSVTLNYAGAIMGTGRLTKLEVGTLVLGGNNTYSGGTMLSGGTLFGGAASQGRTAFGSGAITVGSGTTLWTDRSNLANSLVLGGSTLKGTNGFGVIWSGGISLNADAAVDVSSYMTLSGNISGAGRLNKVGAGVLTLSGANSYSGGTQLSAGTLALGSAGALGSSGTIGFGGGTLRFGGANTTDYSARFATAAGQAYRLDTNGQDISLSANLASSGGTLVKLGAGTLTLLGNTTYSGATTLSAGHLVIRNDAPQLGTSGFSGAGSLTLEPVSDSFSAATYTLSTPINGLSGLVIGKSGNTAGLNLTGDLSVAGSVSIFAGDLSMNTSLSTTAPGDVLLKSSGTLSMASGQQVSASAGDITLVANRFVNQAGAGALLTTGEHVWRLWSTNANPFDATTGDVTGGLVAAYKQYNASQGTSTPLGTGHGLLYSLAPVLSVSLGGSVVREYDGSTVATVLASQLQVTGGVDGDQILLNGPSSAAYTTGGTGPAAKDVGTQKTVEAAGVSLLSASKNSVPVYGYTLASTTASGQIGEITPKEVTLSANKVYDGLLELGQGAVNIQTGVGSETLGYTAARSSDAHVGTAQKFIAALTLADASDGSGGLAINYKLPTLDATKAPVSITAKQVTASASILGADKTYDGLLAASGSSISGSTSGALNGDAVALDVSGMSLAFDNAHVGTRSISASGSVVLAAVTGGGVGLKDGTAGNAVAAQLGDYVLAGQPVIASVAQQINPASILRITGITASDKTFDGSLDASLETSGAVFTGKLASDNLAVATGAVGRFSDSVAGTNKLVSISALALSGADASNYVLLDTTAQTTATITANQVAVATQSVSSVLAAVPKVMPPPAPTVAPVAAPAAPTPTAPAPAPAAAPGGDAPAASATPAAAAAPASTAPSGGDAPAASASAAAPAASPSAAAPAASPSPAAPAAAPGAGATPSAPAAAPAPAAAAPASGSGSGGGAANKADSPGRTDKTAGGKSSEAGKDKTSSAKPAGQAVPAKGLSAAKAAAVSSRVAAARAQVQQGVSAVARSASVNALRERMQAGRLGSDPLNRSQVAIRVQPSPALQNFGNQVVDKVGSQNPLLAENKILPREPERDALLPPPSEMTQSFDAVPSLRSSSTKQKVRHSKSVTLQEETMEAVNFLNLINLRLLP